LISLGSVNVSVFLCRERFAALEWYSIPFGGIQQQKAPHEDFAGDLIWSDVGETARHVEY
jgi:hypothetical protein